MFQYIIPMLPELFKAAELQDHDALARRSQTLLTALCGVTPPLSKLPELLEVIFATIRKSPSWRIRSNTLPMLQILYFRQAPIISEEMVVRIQDVGSSPFLPGFWLTGSLGVERMSIGRSRGSQGKGCGVRLFNCPLKYCFLTVCVAHSPAS